MKILKWRLREELDSRGLSVYALAKELEGQVGRTALHKIAAGQSTVTGMDKISAIMNAIEKKSGREVSLSDVLQWVSAS